MTQKVSLFIAERRKQYGFLLLFLTVVGNKASLPEKVSTTSPAAVSALEGPATPVLAKEPVSDLYFLRFYLLQLTVFYRVNPHQAKKKELTLHEMQALVDLARGSSLLREKTELSILQSTIESVLAKKIAPPQSVSGTAAAVETQKSADNEATTAAPISAAGPSQESERVSKSVERMMGALDNMLKKLEVSESHDFRSVSMEC